jgi:hypothetical protein
LIGGCPTEGPGHPLRRVHIGRAERLKYWNVARGRKLQVWMNQHPMVRYVAFLILMGGVSLYGVWRLVILLSRSEHPGWLAIEAAASLVVLVPLLLVWGPKTRSRHWTFVLPLVVISVLILVALPVRGASDSFPLPAWLQVPGDAFCAAFGFVAATIRTRQRFWQMDWRQGGPATPGG